MFEGVVLAMPLVSVACLWLLALYLVLRGIEMSITGETILGIATVAGGLALVAGLADRQLHAQVGMECGKWGIEEFAHGEVVR